MPQIVTRRTVLRTLAAAGAAAAAAPRVAFAVPKTIKIGLVAPQTGPLAFFTEHVAFTLEQIKRTLGGNITINGTAHPFEILIKDSQSSPNRAAEVAQELIVKDKIDIMAAFATPETVNPVSDQCELNGIPCVSNDAPLEPYFFGRGGDPKKPFDWTYHFFFSAGELSQAMLAFWNSLPTNKVLGGVWPNDDDGKAFSKVFTELVTKNGYKVVDPGRFDMPASNYNAQISAFKAAGVEIVTGVVPPPEFTTFWNESAQQGYRPKAVYMAKATEFPPAVEPLGDRAIGLAVEVWWSPFHPYVSGLNGQSSKELAAEYEKASGRQWSMPLGFRHSLFEIVFDALKRSETLDRPEAIRDAIAATNYNSIVGPINFKTGPFPNTSQTPLVVGQWIKGKKYPYELTLVDNAVAKEVPLTGEPMLISPG